MGQERETNVALLIDFDNVALGARDTGQRFDIKILLQRILEKGKVLVKKAYADWHYYKEHMSPLHEAAVELIEIPMPRISGKNSADIKLVVDAMELCYSKNHINTFVIVSGDSDFSPLVSKLRENNKWVIGVGVKNSSSKLLIGNCDEFIFYDDLFRQQKRQTGRAVKHVPEEKRELFDFLLETTQGLLNESRGVLYSSLIKDTMTRKQPDFNERAYGYSNFGDLLDEARKMGLLIVERDAHAGGTWVVQGVANGASSEGAAEAAESGEGRSRSSRRRRRGSGRGRGAKDGAPQETAEKTGKTEKTQEAKPEAASEKAAKSDTRPEAKASGQAEPEKKASSRKTAKKAPSRKTTKKAPAKKTTKKAPAKKTAKKTTVTKKKTTATKKTTRKAPAKKTTKKAVTKKTARKPAKKAPAKSGSD